MIDFGADIRVLMKLFSFLILVDFMLGIIVAGKEGKLKSRTCSNGIFRSIGELVILAFFAMMNRLIPNIHDYLVMFIGLFIIKELLSLCENLQRLDVWMPKIIINMLSKATETIDKGEIRTKTGDKYENYKI